VNRTLSLALRATWQCVAICPSPGSIIWLDIGEIFSAEQTGALAALPDTICPHTLLRRSTSKKPE
jgi:hypothetical protein